MAPTNSRKTFSYSQSLGGYQWTEFQNSFETCELVSLEAVVLLKWVTAIVIVIVVEMG